MARLRTHPGEVLREEYLVPFGLSARALAKALDVPANRLTEIMRGTRDVSADTAIRLGRYFRAALLAKSSGCARSLQGGEGPQLQENRATQGGLSGGTYECGSGDSSAQPAPHSTRARPPRSYSSLPISKMK
jgi:addiction module HigA family antidote